MKGKAINICPAVYKTLISSFLALVNLNLSWNGAVKPTGVPFGLLFIKIFSWEWLDLNCFITGS